MNPVRNPLIDISHDGHVHTLLCGHAVGRMEEYVQAALARGLSGMCFLEHLEAGIVYFKRNWLEASHFAEYFREGERLQKAYKGRMVIQLGAELGYNPAAVDELRARLRQYPFERVGLSCHYYWHGDRHWNLLGLHPDSLNRFRVIGADTVLTRYFDNLIHAAEELDCSVLCHLDAGLRHLPGLQYQDSHRAQIRRLLATVKARGMMLEINTSGFARRGYPYPTDWIIREAIGMGIPLTPGSDAHDPEEVGRYFEQLPAYLAALRP